MDCNKIYILKKYNHMSPLSERKLGVGGSKADKVLSVTTDLVKAKGRLLTEAQYIDMDSQMLPLRWFQIEEYSINGVDIKIDRVWKRMGWELGWECCDEQ